MRPIDFVLFTGILTGIVSTAIPLVSFLVLFGTISSLNAGTWSDRFSEQTVGSDWRGNRNFFSIRNGALSGESASPVPVSPLNYLEVGTNWTNYTVRCRINVVEPNLRVCSKGALILRHSGDEGYVFALHTATKTIEVYRLSNHEMLLSKDAPLIFDKWHDVRAELQGAKMSFFVDDQLIGTVTDTRSASGAIGVAVQDVEEALFDDFVITGPDVSSNGLEISRSQQQVTLSWPSAWTNYVLKATDDLNSASQWASVTNSVTSSAGQNSVTVSIVVGSRFYRLFPNSPRFAGVGLYSPSSELIIREVKTLGTITVRFSELVKHSGKPEPLTLWIDPSKPDNWKMEHWINSGSANSKLGQWKMGQHRTIGYDLSRRQFPDHLNEDERVEGKLPGAIHLHQLTDIPSNTKIEKTLNAIDDLGRLMRISRVDPGSVHWEISSVCVYPSYRRMPRRTPSFPLA